MQEEQQQKLSMAEKFAYAMGDCGANVYVAVTSTFLTALYTDTAGIAAAAVGTMMLATRVFDGGSDLIMGAVVDKTKTRWGKARPWLLWSAPLMAIGFILLMNIPSGFSSGGKLVYAYVTYIFMNCIPFVFRFHGSAAEEPLGHVFHCNIKSEAAKRCNDEECAFFKEFL
ncbi:MAG: MFS transporter [Clostridiales bacterium]|nr:MFS transporter [Clostridiales bacterium]